MFELTINNAVYQFNFGFGFLRDINKTYKSVDEKTKQERELGLQYNIASLIDGGVEAIVTILDIANKGCDPRITRKDIEKYIEDENTNIDDLFDTVMDFLSKANCTKKEVQKFMENLEELKKNQN